MITFFSTGIAKNKQINNINDIRLREFDKAVNSVLLNLAKRVVSDGEGSSKFIQIDVLKCKTENDAKKIGFSIANSPLVKTAIAGEDGNWGRIMMAIGKTNIDMNADNITLIFGNNKIVEKGQLIKSFSSENLDNYMKNDNIHIIVDMNIGKKNFTCYTMDLTNKYIKINKDYRT